MFSEGEPQIFERIDLDLSSLAEDFILPELYCSYFPSIPPKELADWIFEETRGVFGGYEFTGPKIIDFQNKKIKSKIFSFPEIQKLDDHICACAFTPEICISRNQILEMLNYLINNKDLEVVEGKVYIFSGRVFGDRLWYEEQ